MQNFRAAKLSQFDDNEEVEELRTPKTTKRRKQSMRDDLVETPKVICVVMSGERWCVVYWFAGMQNPLSALEHKAVSILLQKSLVPWLIILFCMDYPSKITADLVRQMIAAL